LYSNFDLTSKFTYLPKLIVVKHFLSMWASFVGLIDSRNIMKAFRYRYFLTLSAKFSCLTKVEDLTTVAALPDIVLFFFNLFLYRSLSPFPRIFHT